MAWKDIDDNILTKKALYEDLLEEREDINPSTQEVAALICEEEEEGPVQVQDDR